MLYSFVSVVALAGTAAAQQCYWNGQIAIEVAPCSTSNNANSACCPLNGQAAQNLYFPLAYQVCTSNGLCKAGNSNFSARGACTDPTWNSPGCPGYCRDANATGMAGITDCGNGGPWYCCNSDHDAGACVCSPPGGSAFALTGNAVPLYYSQLAGNASASSILAGIAASGSGAVVTSTVTTQAAASITTQRAAQTTTTTTSAQQQGTTSSAAGGAAVGTTTSGAGTDTNMASSTSGVRSTVTVFATPSAASSAALTSNVPSAGAVRGREMGFFGAGVVALIGWFVM